MMTKTCDNCSNSLLEGAVFCAECGQKYEEKITPVGMGCSTCGNPMDPGQKFCSSCGSKNEPKSINIYCHNCGVEHQEGVKFCFSCGNQLSQKMPDSVSHSSPKQDLSANTHTTKSQVNREKYEAVEFVIKSYNNEYKLVTIFFLVVTIFTLGLFLPILLICWYVKRKRNKKVTRLRETILNKHDIYNRIRAARGFNSVSVDFDGESLEVPQGYIWFSKYNKRSLCQLLNS